MSEQLHPDIESIVLSEQDIKDIVARLGAEISIDYADKNPLIVAVLRGAFVFMADLVRAVTVPCTVDFMAVSSYGTGVKSSGEVRIVKDLDTKIEGRHVIIAEDILDSGLTLSYLVKLLEGRGAASVSIVAFAVKDVPGHTPPVTVDYVGTHVPNEFIVGYGLDYAEHYRNLPYVGVLKLEVYS
jgi:hypoxanthine phosphoribosyltransferase